MKFTDGFFKFPIRIFDPNYDFEKAEEHLSLYGERPFRDFLTDWARIKPQDIMTWESTFSIYTKEIDKGKLLTQVMSRDNEWLCSWSREKFETELDKFVDNFHEETIKEIESELEEEQQRQELSAENITPEVAKELEKILKEYKKQQKNVTTTTQGLQNV